MAHGRWRRGPVTAVFINSSLCNGRYHHYKRSRIPNYSRRHHISIPPHIAVPPCKPWLAFDWPRGAHRSCISIPPSHAEHGRSLAQILDCRGALDRAHVELLEPAQSSSAVALFVACSLHFTSDKTELRTSSHFLIGELVQLDTVPSGCDDGVVSAANVEDLDRIWSGATVVHRRSSDGLRIAHIDQLHTIPVAARDNCVAGAAENESCQPSSHR